MLKGGENVGFDGWLLKINGIEFPNFYIQAQSYKSTPNQISDLDSYTDADGLLHRNVLPHKSTKIEFNTIPLYLTDKAEVQSFFSDRVTVSVEYWNDETNSYMTGTFYTPDIVFEYYRVDRAMKTIMYKPIRIALIEY